MKFVAAVDFIARQEKMVMISLKAVLVGAVSAKLVQLHHCTRVKIGAVGANPFRDCTNALTLALKLALTFLP